MGRDAPSYEVHHSHPTQPTLKSILAYYIQIYPKQLTQEDRGQYQPNQDVQPFEDSDEEEDLHESNNKIEFHRRHA